MKHSGSLPLPRLASQAKALFDAGQYRQAEPLFRELSRLQPKAPEALLMVAVCQTRGGDLEQAARTYRKLLKRHPDYTPARLNLGNVLAESGQPQKAADCYRQCLARDRRFFPAYEQLARLLATQGNTNQASTVLADAAKVASGNELNTVAEIQKELGDIEGAIKSLTTLVSKSSVSATVLSNLGSLLAEKKRLREAREMYKKAIELPDANAYMYLNAVQALAFNDELEAATKVAEEGLRRFPDISVSHLGVALIQVLAGNLSEGRVELEKAQELEPITESRKFGLFKPVTGPQDSLLLPAMAESLFVTVWVEQLNVCSWRDFEARKALCETYLMKGADNTETVPIKPFETLLLPVNPEIRSLIAARYSRAIESFTQDWRNAPETGTPVEPSKPIRLGFISPDLRKHAIGFLVRDLFSLLDPARFEVHIYDLNPKPGDEISEQIRTTSPHYMDLSASTNREAVARIRQDGIDMLVDLAGYTALARPEILAARPAPLQINHMGFPGSMQAGFIDYVIGCPLLIPVGHEEHYSESVIRLPQVHNMVSGWPSPAVTPSRADCGLPEDTLVFACFNGNRKIDPELFNVWMNILRRLPKSVLWLLGDNGDAETNLRAGATARGIDPGRIIFAGRISTDGHIARLRQADLYLDTCLYSAFTNLSMALWAGLPVLSLLGRDYATRMGAAAVQAAGLPELIVDDLEAYENLAVDLGRDGARLKSFKQRLAGLGHSSPLFDKAQYVRDLEAGLKQAWSRYLEGKEPADIDVESKPVSDG